MTAPLKNEINAFCARLGGDPLLVQGAGGNVSWKDGDVLWIKASGTWLAQALHKDIFTPVHLPALKQALAAQNFTVAPTTLPGATLRPSIETLLHALMPHNIVAHLHAVEILAHLVRPAPRAALTERLGDSLDWTLVPYVKPGAELAAAVAAALAHKPQASVIFLCNHGVVIGGDSIAEVEHLLAQLTHSLRTTPTFYADRPTPPAFTLDRYRQIEDVDLNQLATQPELAARLPHDWALFPDHVVFLGRDAVIIDPAAPSSSATAPFAFVPGIGTFIAPATTPAQRAQLRCYYDTLVRQQPGQPLTTLTPAHIADLLDWEAEKFRTAQNAEATA